MLTRRVRHQQEPDQDPEHVEGTSDVEHGLPAQTVRHEAGQGEDGEGAEAGPGHCDPVEASLLLGRGPGPPGPGHRGEGHSVEAAEDDPGHQGQHHRDLGHHGEQEGGHRAPGHGQAKCQPEPDPGGDPGGGDHGDGVAPVVGAHHKLLLTQTPVKFTLQGEAFLLAESVHTGRLGSVTGPRNSNHGYHGHTE